MRPDSCPLLFCQLFGARRRKITTTGLPPAATLYWRLVSVLVGYVGLLEAVRDPEQAPWHIVNLLPDTSPSKDLHVLKNTHWTHSYILLHASTLQLLCKTRGPTNYPSPVFYRDTHLGTTEKTLATISAES